MRFGLKDEEILFLEETLIRPLMSQGARVWIFGSRARSDHRPFSDVDVLYSLPSGHVLPSAWLPRIQEIFGRIEPSL